MSQTGKYSQITAALLTPPGFGGIAVVKLYGQAVDALLAEIFTSHSLPAVDTIVPGKYYLGEIRDSEQVIDQVMVVLSRDNDNTALEIQSHGGPRIIQRLFILLTSYGVQVISWHMLEAPASIAAEQEYILATLKTELAITTIAAQYPAGLAAWCQTMISGLSNSTITHDDYKKQATALLNYSIIADRLLKPSRVFLIGPPNAGKSTLANHLTGRSQSLVSDLPGTTRDWTSELTDMAGLPVELVDTAGTRDTSDHLESLSLTRLKDQLNDADLYLILIPADFSGSIENEIVNIKAHLAPGKPFITVLSKSELLKGDCSSRIDILVSAVTGQGTAQLHSKVKYSLGIPADFSPQAPILFTPRQRNLITDSLTLQPQHISQILKTCLGH